MFKSARKNRWGFTLVELLVVIAIIALLISILLPSLARAREQAKRMKCFGNLKDIAAASNAYALEDANELLVPIRTMTPNNWIGPADMEYMSVGKGGHDKYWATGSLNDRREFTQFTSRNPNGPGDRPLNKYLYSGIANSALGDLYRDMEIDNSVDMQIAHCPSDVGFDTARDGRTLITFFEYWMIPGGFSLQEPLYDALGTSYKIHNFVQPFDGMQQNAWGHSFTAILHPMSQIPLPSRQVIFSESNSFWTFLYNTPYWSGLQGPAIEMWALGWHGEKQVFVSSFADGHAAKMDQNVRMQPVAGFANGRYVYEEEWRRAGTQTENLILPDGDPVENVRFQFRGPSWQIDCLPSPPTPIHFGWHW